MNNRQFCKQRNPLRNSAALALAALSLACAAPAARASTPEWLRAAAREPMPPYPKDTVAVLLYSERITTVKDKGEIETLYRSAYRILRTEGRNYGKVVVFFDKETKLTYLKAWSLPADGKEYEVKEKDAVELGPFGDELYSDIREKVLTIPAAEPGNVVGYEYVQKERPFILQDKWFFQERIPARHVRFALQLPAGWEFDSFWENYAEQKPQEAGANQFVWELQDVPAVKVEPEMPPWGEVAGRLVVTYVPSGSSAASGSHRTWKDLGLWYNSLTSASRGATPEIKKAVAEVTAGLATPLDKTKALASFLQRRIRYVAVEIGIGGMQPHSAGEVFTHKYGDCKDKVTLLSTMLREAGIESYYVLINTERGIVRPEVPELEFDHMIMAIRLPEDASTDGLYVVLDHPRLGRLLFFDPTDPYTPLGYLPPFEQANHGLLMTPEGGELVALPLVGPKTNHLLRSATLHLAGDGTLSGSVEETRSGANASRWRAEFLESSETERTKMLENYLSNNMARAAFRGAALQDLDKFDHNLGLTYSFQTQNYAKTAGNLLIFQPRVLGEESSSLLEAKERKYPVELGQTVQMEDVFTITLPPGYVVDDLPSPTQAEYAFGSYHSETQVQGDTLRYKRTYEIRNVQVPAQGLGDLRKFYRQISTDERASAILRRATP